MIRRSLFTFLVLSPLSSHAVRLPKRPLTPPPACQSLLGANRLVVGQYPAHLEQFALSAVLDTFQTLNEDEPERFEGMTIRAALVLADGAVLFLVDSNTRTPSNTLKVSTHAVRVSPAGQTEVTPVQIDRLPTAEQTPEQMIAHEALTAAREDFPLNHALPGMWAGGGAPDIQSHAVALTIATGPDRGVALLEVVARGVTIAEARMYAVAEVRDGELYSMTDLVDRPVDTAGAVPVPGPPTLTEALAIQHVQEHIARQTPPMKVSSYRAHPSDDEGATFTVWADVSKGRLGTRATIYHVSVQADGQINVTAIAAQG